MLLCRGCGTRFESGREACPSCGRRAKTHAVDAGASDSGLPPVGVAPDKDEPDEVELEANAVVEKADVDDTPAVRTPIPAPIRPPTPAASRVAAPAPAAPAAAPAARRRRPAPAPVPRLALDAGQVRALLAEQPGLIEKGLGVHADDAGRPVGVDFETPVGAIDLLARDLRGGYVIVLVPEPEDGADLVPGLLRRMGWVRKHLCAAGENVRAIAVLNELPESALYAAAGLGEGVLRFVGYRVALEFHDHRVD
jgi:hypothetical protein